MRVEICSPIFGDMVGVWINIGVGQPSLLRKSLTIIFNVNIANEMSSIL